MTAEAIARALTARRSGSCWMAKCPAHDDRTPSLSIQEVDGTILLHCFAGCETVNVLAAIGMTLSDLYSDTRFEHRGRQRPFLTAGDVLLLLDHESLLVAAVAADIAAGRPVSCDDISRISEARQRIMRVREVVRSA